MGERFANPRAGKAAADWKKLSCQFVTENAHNGEMKITQYASHTTTPKRDRRQQPPPSKHT
uniref:hypothetical protein n=1 Tax=Shinella sp. TaxID=1870904 RepID=UPI004036F18A